MKKEGKIILTDINADRNREESIGRFQALLAAGFKNYATIKMSMNLFTMRKSTLKEEKRLKDISIQ